MSAVDPIKVIDINLDLARVTAQPQAIPVLVEGDTGNVFEITLTYDGVPVDLSDCRVLAVFSKVSDGTTSEQDTEDGYVGLTSYGITLTGTPADEDTISVESYNGYATATTDVSGGSVTVDAATFRSKLPDGEYVFVYDNDATSWILGQHSVRIGGTDHNEITIDLKNSSYGAGKNNCELQVYSGDDFKTLVTTAQFNFDGRKGITNNDTIRQTSEYPLLMQLMEQTLDALAKALPWTTINASAVAANTAGVTVTVAADSVTMAFQIPNSVYVGDTQPTGDEEVWIIPNDDGEIEDTPMGTGTYDQNGNGVVDDAEKLDGQLPSYYAKASDLTAEITNRGTAVSNEATARANADSAEVTNRNSAISSAIATEVSNRNSAISTAIATEVTNRNAAISSSIATNVTNKKGAANGLASLDSDKKVTADQASAKVGSSITANKTIALTDAGRFFLVNSTSTVKIKIPTDANVAFPTGTELEFCRYNTGAVQFEAVDSDTTSIRSVNSLKKIAVQYGTVGLKKIGANKWLLTGCLG